MPSKWAWIILCLAICVTASLEHDEWTAFIRYTEFDYEDMCFNTAEAEWTFVNYPSGKTLSIWVNIQYEVIVELRGEHSREQSSAEDGLVDYADFKHIQRLEVVNRSLDDSTSDSSSKYRYDSAVTVGDALLNSSDFRTLVDFAGTAELKRLSAAFRESNSNYTRRDAERVLYFNNNANKKKRVWAAWHQELDVLAENVSTILPLVAQAAEENGAKDVTQYWELLSGYKDGYEKIKYEWTRITRLHKKILQHVRNNLSHKYKIDANQTIPAYLLGSLQGSDWTPVAVDVSTEPDLIHNIKKNLWKRKLLGRSLYRTASDMGTQLLDNAPELDFWEKSNFKGQCPSKLINFCKDGAMRVSTCYEPTLSNYLSAHKNVGKVVYNQITLQNIPVLTTANRYSVLEESVGELFGILAASPAWLNHSRIVDKSTDKEQLLMVSLMITALDVLPRLAYYMSADMWRIEANETGMKPEDLTSSWWQYRQEYEGLDNNGTKIPTFLNDDHITSNKPYLPKLTGTILAFQIYEYIMESTEVRYEPMLGRHSKDDILKLVQKGGSDEWSRIINNVFEIDEISADAMLSFFSPLEDLIDELDDDFEYKPVTINDSELHDLEKKTIAEMNAPTTTTTGAPPTVIERRKIVTTTPSSKENSLRGDGNALEDRNKSLGSKSSVHETEEKPQDHNPLGSEATNEGSPDESLDDSVELNGDTKPKMNTSKAVWAVGAVLLATIVICLIAIFYRQRCRKMPKNRRYV